MSDRHTVPALRELPWCGGINRYRWGGVSSPLRQRHRENEVTVVSTHPGSNERLMLSWEGNAQSGRGGAHHSPCLC